MKKRHMKVCAMLFSCIAVLLLCTIGTVDQALSENLFDAIAIKPTRMFIRYTVNYPEDCDEALRDYYLETTAEIFEYRAATAGFEDITVKDDRKDSVRVAVPDGCDIEALLEAIETPWRFRIEEPDMSTVITGKHLKQVYPTTDVTDDPESGDAADGKWTLRYAMVIELDDEGTALFKESTARSIGKEMKMYVDDQLILNPTVLSAIEDGRINVTGLSDQEEAKTMSCWLLSCHLPLETRRDGVYLTPTIVDTIFGREPENAGYESVTLKRYFDETIQ